MNFDDLLTKILEIAEFPEDKREEFKSTFYNFYISSLIREIGEVDNVSGEKLENSLEGGQENFDAVLAELAQNPNVQSTADGVLEKLLNQFVEDITNSATEEQKQKILAILPAN